MLSSFLESFPRTQQAVRRLGERCREAGKSQAMLSTFLPGCLRLLPFPKSCGAPGPCPSWVPPCPGAEGEGGRRLLTEPPVDPWEWGQALDRLAPHESSLERPRDRVLTVFVAARRMRVRILGDTLLTRASVKMRSFRSRLSWLTDVFQETISDLNLLLWWYKILQNNRIYIVKQLFINVKCLYSFIWQIPSPTLKKKDICLSILARQFTCVFIIIYWHDLECRMQKSIQ